MDVVGLLLEVYVGPANEADCHGVARLLNAELREKYPTLEVSFADLGYDNDTAKAAAADAHVRLELPAAAKGAKKTGFRLEVHQWRWIVERTFAWLSRCRRLSKDYEATVAAARAWIYIAMIGFMCWR